MAGAGGGGRGGAGHWGGEGRGGAGGGGGGGGGGGSGGGGGGGRAPPATRAPDPRAAGLLPAVPSTGSLVERVITALTTFLSASLDIAVENINVAEPFAEYGLDSIL